ncbi:hypothetical protein MH117_26260 [Paenibacillus sp. ACRRX]|uniref:hypothetical protein n=1 Tax=Paenibacillus sp. ACRRX TaxID=2918206 RepID=UPI001EF702B1|nr:hypothetical protein [Paenibacillus sp. ACRRX]MCG7410891.1 hypothetical protein [Paenibacillus sp. ACRRX]
MSRGSNLLTKNVPVPDAYQKLIRDQFNSSHAFNKGTGQSANNFKWGNPKSTPTYGHAFSEHGVKKKPNQLIDRAKGKGHQIGQWLDEKSAADFLAGVAKKGPGVYEVSLPSSIKSRGYLPNGTDIKPDMVRVIVKENGGIRSAFPYSSAHPSGIGK